jgi:hypothetical protein
MATSRHNILQSVRTRPKVSRRGHLQDLFIGTGKKKYTGGNDMLFWRGRLTRYQQGQAFLWLPLAVVNLVTKQEGFDRIVLYTASTKL